MWDRTRTKQKTTSKVVLTLQCRFQHSNYLIVIFPHPMLRSTSSVDFHIPVLPVTYNVILHIILFSQHRIVFISHTILSIPRPDPLISNNIQTENQNLAPYHKDQDVHQRLFCQINTALSLSRNLPTLYYNLFRYLLQMS